MICNLVLLIVFLLLGCGESLATPMDFLHNFMGEKSYSENNGMVTSVYNWGYLEGLPCIVFDESGEPKIGKFPRIPAGLVQVTNDQTGSATMMAYWKYAEPSLVTSGKAQKVDGKWQVLDVPEDIYVTFKDVPFLWFGNMTLAEGCEEIYRREGDDSVTHTTAYEGEGVEAAITNTASAKNSHIQMAGYDNIAIPRDSNGQILGASFQSFQHIESFGDSEVLTLESHASITISA